MPTKTAKKKPTAKKKVTAKTSRAKAMLSIQAAGVDPAGSGKLPAGSVKLTESGLTINVQRLSRGLLQDQRARLVSSMGCISNPGGPGC